MRRRTPLISVGEQCVRAVTCPMHAVGYRRRTHGDCVSQKNFAAPFCSSVTLARGFHEGWLPSMPSDWQTSASSAALILSLINVFCCLSWHIHAYLFAFPAPGSWLLFSPKSGCFLPPKSVLDFTLLP